MDTASTVACGAERSGEDEGGLNSIPAYHCGGGGGGDRWADSADAKNKMELESNRMRIMIVAFIDKWIHLGFLGFCTVYWIWVTLQLSSMDEPCWAGPFHRFAEQLTPDLATTFYQVLWVILLVGLVSRAIQFYTAVKLMHAAHLAKDGTDADKRTRPWRRGAIAGGFICPVVSTVLGVSLYVVPMTLDFIPFIYSLVAVLFCEFIWRVIAFCIVVRFRHQFPHSYF